MLCSRRQQKAIKGAKVLTSEESLALMQEKARKKKEEEEAKAQRKRQREENKAMREEEKRRKVEERARKAEERKRVAEEKQLQREHRANLKQKGNRKISLKDGNASGLQTAEVSSNECAVCLGEYEDDVTKDGDLLYSWVECTNPECKKWMHEQCLHKNL